MVLAALLSPSAPPCRFRSPRTRRPLGRGRVCAVPSAWCAPRLPGRVPVPALHLLAVGPGPSVSRRRLRVLLSPARRWTLPADSGLWPHLSWSAALTAAGIASAPRPAPAPDRRTSPSSPPPPAGAARSWSSSSRPHRGAFPRSSSSPTRQCGRVVATAPPSALVVVAHLTASRRVARMERRLSTTSSPAWPTAEASTIGSPCDQRCRRRRGQSQYVPRPRPVSSWSTTAGPRHRKPLLEADGAPAGSIRPTRRGAPLKSTRFALAVPSGAASPASPRTSADPCVSVCDGRASSTPAASGFPFPRRPRGGICCGRPTAP